MFWTQTGVYMSLLKVAADLFISQLGSKSSGLSLETVTGALQNLLPTQSGDLDLAALVGKFTGQGGDLVTVATSWLGDGSNKAININQIITALGQSKMDNFASEIGLDTNTAASGLADILPELINKNSDGGSLLGGLASSAAKSVLGKLF